MKPWTITYGGHTWTDTNATVLHMVAVAELTDDSWAAVSPWSGPRQLAAWLAVLLSTVVGDLDQATATVYAMSPTDLAAALTERNGDATPNEGLTATTTSK